MGRQPRTLRGKVIVVTGGAQGIGATTVGALVRRGARVAIGDLDLVRAEKAAAELGPDTIALPLDVTDTRGFTAFLDEVEHRLGPIDVLINNAGIMPLAALEEEDDASTRRQLEINLHAVIHGTREAVQRMRPRRSGHIVNVASMAGKAGFPGGATYCATKHGVVGLSEAVHLELHGTGVDVSCVLPAIVRTELASGLKEAKMIKSVSPEEVAAAIVDALERPRFDVYVPKSLDALGRVTRLLPRSFGEWLVRTLGGDQVLASATHSSARADYEARAAESAPGAGSEERT
ncbi:SDR family oxidoreductase [Amycolatopsis cihanbeyliensis]|uniref:Short-subunit dehydrogenase n=1 Tax=Amycolatopsis cihanbeyliensis TaxID=1128664 RepID=A0A542DHH0_AMYCI|nr:SDR family oxidoreductase [Amycolatopsis cihanbeyliensis]TQJ02490.1 short-subunit dehydrogenase [Amycolatopsis cihanbeyliensis]